MFVFMLDHPQVVVAFVVVVAVSLLVVLIAATAEELPVIDPPHVWPDPAFVKADGVSLIGLMAEPVALFDQDRPSWAADPEYLWDLPDK